MTPREEAEFRALRATIGQRGTLRLWFPFAALGTWGAATIATATLGGLPVATFLPLLLLAAGFEALFQLHTGVERIGRYLQIFYADQEGSGPGRDWERTIMAYGRAYPGGSDPLFTLYFLFATVLNFVPVIIAEPVPLELIVVGAGHLAFVARLFILRHRASGQRPRDLERFQRIKDGG